MFGLKGKSCRIYFLISRISISEGSGIAVALSQSQSVPYQGHSMPIMVVSKGLITTVRSIVRATCETASLSLSNFGYLVQGRSTAVFRTSLYPQGKCHDGSCGKTLRSDQLLRNSRVSNYHMKTSSDGEFGERIFGCQKGGILIQRCAGWYVSTV